MRRTRRIAIASVSSAAVLLIVWAVSFVRPMYLARWQAIGLDSGVDANGVHFYYGVDWLGIQEGEFGLFYSEIGWNDGLAQISLNLIWIVALLAVVALFTFRKSRILARGYCTICGYDLRASRDRCPECGTPIPHDGSSAILRRG